MHILSFLPALAMVLLTSGMISAADEPITPPKPEAPSVVNTVCPMDGKMVGKHPAAVRVTVGEGAEAKHYRMGFCSMECCTQFTKDPIPVLGGRQAPGPKTNFK
jgi:hypothetical protein